MNRLLAAMIPGLRRSIERDMQGWADAAAFRRRVAAKEAREAADHAEIALRLRRGEVDPLNGVRGTYTGRDYSATIKEMKVERGAHLQRSYGQPKPSVVRSSPRPVPPRPEYVIRREVHPVEDDGPDLADAVALGVAIGSLFNNDDKPSASCEAPPPIESGGGGDFGGGGATGSWDDSSSSSTDSDSTRND